jgi:hypothetical protein
MKRPLRSIFFELLSMLPLAILFASGLVRYILGD